MTRTAVVGVFDSGIGGLSVRAAIQRRWPGLSLPYCADNVHFPYGEWEEARLEGAILKSVARFVAATGPDVLVVACNTASTFVLPALRAQFSMPIVGVVPAIKPAVALTKTGVIGLLATAGTVRRPYIDELWAQYHSIGQRLVRVGSSELVHMAERKLRGQGVDVEDLRRALAPLFVTEADGRRVDVVVLGCTHFPHLEPEFAQTAPWPIHWLSSGDAVAARVGHLLGEAVASLPKRGGTQDFYFTCENADARDMEGSLAAMGFSVKALT